MNFKYINRKQALGTLRPTDFTDWAQVEDNKLIRRFHSKTTSLLWKEFTAEDMWAHKQWFDSVVDELGLEFHHQDAEPSFHANIIQSIEAEARRADILFYMMDIRPISELGEGLNDLEFLDKMVVECGFNPINTYWLEYSPEDGRQTLKVMFEISVVSYDPDHAKQTEENGLADPFLACFDESVRFYGNRCYAPWEGRSIGRPCVQSKILQSLREVDCGLILRDEKHIGFLLLADDYP